jgi:hypothetical protein
MFFLLLLLVVVSETAYAASVNEFQPDWEKGLAHLPEVVEQRMLRAQSQLFKMIHERKLDELHRIFTLIEEALVPIHLPVLKTPLEEHLAQLHEHYVEQSGTTKVAKISAEDVAKLKQTFRS